MADIFDIQDDVAGAITDALQLHLAPVSDRPTHSPEAYALYLEALAQLDSSQNYQGPIDLLDRAIRLDPKFAKAYELEATVYWFASAITLESSTAQPLVYEAATKAIELDPSLVLARALTRTANPYNWNWFNEFQAIEEAIRADPDNVRILAVWTYDLIMAGYFQEGLHVARRVIELDPLSTIGYYNTAAAYSALGRRADAHATWVRVRDIGYEELGATNQAFRHIIAREYDEGVAALGDWSVDGMTGQHLKDFIESATDPESGLEFLRSWVDKTVSNTDSYSEQIGAKYWFLYLGYLDDYWRNIEEVAPESPSTWTNAENLEFLGKVYHAGGFRRHPSYIPYETKYGMIELWETRGAPDTCSKTNGRWVCE
jgi:tetratricopeptide (TPR) repeat protein